MNVAQNSKPNSKKKGEHLKPFAFKPGQSGNPGGRPKRKVLSEAYRDVLGREVPDDPKGRTFAELIADQMVLDAVKGKNKVACAAEIADRTEGKSPQIYLGVVKHEMTERERAEAIDVLEVIKQFAVDAE